MQQKNDFPEQPRAAVVELLNARLADNIDLMHQAKQAHGNVKGSNFIALHKLFDKIVYAAEEYMDLLAERRPTGRYGGGNDPGCGTTHRTAGIPAAYLG